MSYESEFDEITNRLLSGDITNESAEILANGITKTTRDKHEKSKKICKILEYTPTDSFMEYFIGDDFLHISYISSGQERLGGCSYLLSEVAEVARRNNISSLELEVWETNPALQIYQGKGFVEIDRSYPDNGEGVKILMRKKV